MFTFFRKKKSLIKNNPNLLYFQNTHTILQFRNTGYINENEITILGTLQIKYKNNKHYTIDETILKIFIDKLAKEKIHNHETYIDKIYEYIQGCVYNSNFCFVPETMFNNLDLTIGFIKNNETELFELQLDSNDLLKLVPEDILGAELFKLIDINPAICITNIQPAIKSLKIYTNIIKPKNSNRKTLILHQENNSGIVFVNDILRYSQSVNRFDNWTIQHIFNDFSNTLKSKDNSLVVVLKEDLCVDFTKIELCYNKVTTYIDEFLDANNIKNLVYYTY